MNTKTEISKICVDCKKEFVIDLGDLILYKKIGLKIPEQCFFCRFKQYSAFWVFGKFRKGISDLSGENLITVLPNNARYPIYKSHEWWGDGWDPMNFGQDYDSSRFFFGQLKELQEKIPRPHQTGENRVGCDWCDDIWDSKNCYLSRSLSKCENLSYSYRIVEAKDSFDLVFCFNLQNSYECIACHDSYNLSFSENCKDCINSCFLFDCRNCQNCFMCWNLRNKQYCIENVQYSQKDYKEKLRSFKLGSHMSIQAFKKRFEELTQEETVHRQNFNFKTYNSAGDYLINTKDCRSEE